MRFWILVYICASMKLWNLVWLSLLWNGVLAQTINMDGINVRNIGPAGMSGRFTGIAVDNKGHIYAGAASGGVWKSEDGGLAWKPIFDSMPVQSIGAIAVHANNDDIVWVGTGEGNPRNSHNSGAGIYRSLDAGKTWQLMGLEQTKNIHRIVLDPADENKITVGVLGVAWGKTAERGIYQSTDGGKTWTQKLSVNENTGCAELVMDPNNHNKMIAAMWEFNRKPYHFTSGGVGSGMYMTVDGGKTWQKIEKGLPTVNIGRMGLAIAASNSQRVYALVESNEIALYRSDDGGYSWIKTSNNTLVGNRPFYYAEIYVDPSNENHVISLWSQVTHSIDGGKNWEVLASWNHVHPDHHALWINAKNPKHMINGNDGGINISYDGGRHWRQVDNLPVGQFYHVAVDDGLPYNVYGGLQDNGSWKGPGFSFNYGGLRSSQWQELLYGDGFDVQPVNKEEGYAMSQGGNLYYYNTLEGYRKYIQPVKETEQELRWNWNSPIALTGNKQTVFYGSQYVHMSQDKGQSWKIISPDLSTNDSAKLHQARSGGLTIDATNAENYCTIVSLAVTSSDEILWAGTDDGNIWSCKGTESDFGIDYNNWKKYSINGLPSHAYIQQIVVDEDEKQVWVVANNYRQNDWNAYLFYSGDAGKTWKNIETADVKAHCLSFRNDSKNKDLYFLGTDRGLYISYNAGKKWTRYTKLPACPVQDMVIEKRNDDLVIGTFGRSIWILDDLETMRQLNNTIKDSLKIVSFQLGFWNQMGMPPGERFANDDRFKGENKDLRSIVNFNYAGTAKKAKISISTQDGKTIRSYTSNLKNGLNMAYWHGETNGLRWPSYQNYNETEDLPGGAPLLQSGQYWYKIEIDNFKDSILFQYNNTISYNQPYTQENQKRYDTLTTIISKAHKAFEDLKAAKVKLQAAMNQKYKTDSMTQEVKKTCKRNIDLIDTLQLQFMVPPWFTAYEEITPRLNKSLYSAYSHITSNTSPETSRYISNAQRALEAAKNHSQQVFAQINNYFETEWPKDKLEIYKTWQKLEETFGGY